MLIVMWLKVVVPMKNVTTAMLLLLVGKRSIDIDERVVGLAFGVYSDGGKGRAMLIGRPVTRKNTNAIAIMSGPEIYGRNAVFGLF